jgi:hypothetical protein
VPFLNSNLKAAIVECKMNQLVTKRNTVKTKVLAMSPLSLALAACGGGGSNDVADSGSRPSDGGSSDIADNGSPPSGLPGASLTKGSLTATTSTLFDRTLDVYGVKLLVGGASGSQDAVPDAWAHKVAQSYVMLMDPTGSNIDVAAQENMKKILSGEDGTWHEGFGTSQRILKGAGSEYPLNPLQDFN